ncbi:sulfite exporter TauE/SafE family protein [Arsenicicoccus dermatophilus]|uniref:sulfite exporter TauE/SafE family protein n=1 Tax=Arsenicicoccus dermatophilus TaxID=1076331 RepID=UPI001F4D1B14|nr:TSUP family transporter [Arsenicicoccus dermatophilus]MCH8612866.1 TSUP family transporter [Arsenicicoccus dermatophilus]
MGDLSAPVLAGLVAAAFCAGWVDAVVGGGGLIQLPALLLGLPGATPAQVLATNKLASICGTTSSAATYYRRVRPDLRTAIPLALAAFAGSLLGAVVATRIPKAAFNPIILVALVVVGTCTVLKPSLGSATRLRWSGRRHLAAALAVGALIGCYDGALGPGTGSFFVFALVGLLGYAFLEASAKAKIANLATNLAALGVFVPRGAVIWPVGLAMGAANVAGGYLGARTAVARGTGFVRVVFVVVVGGFVIRIGGQLLGLW